MSDDAFQRLENPDAFAHRPLGSVRVRGRKKLLVLHEIFEADPAELKEHKLSTRALFAAAVDAFEHHRYEEASQLFASLLESNADDGPARYYLGRARLAIEHGDQDAKRD
jgi:two-component system sensor histidine kinase ChiS